MSALEHTVSAIKRTHADLATLNPNFLLFIAFLFCKPNVWSRRRKHIFNLVSFLSLTHISFCKFFILDVHFQFYYVIFSHARINPSINVRMKPRHWYTFIFSCIVHTILLFKWSLCSIFLSIMWLKSCDWLWSSMLQKLDIRCVSSNGYIEWFNLNWISIMIRWLNGYIGWFDLRWIFVVICTMDGFIESFDRVYRKIEHVWIFYNS